MNIRLWRIVFHQNSGLPGGGRTVPRRIRIRLKIMAEETMLRKRRNVNGGITFKPIFIVGKVRPHNNVTEPIRI
jgi:hypothetical protein